MSSAPKNRRSTKPLVCHALAEGDRIVSVLTGLDALKIREGLPAWPESSGMRLIRVRVEEIDADAGAAPAQED